MKGKFIPKSLSINVELVRKLEREPLEAPARCCPHSPCPAALLAGIMKTLSASPLPAGPSWVWLSQVKVTAVHGLADYQPAQLPPLHTELLCDGLELCPVPAKLPSLHP